MKASWKLGSGPSVFAISRLQISTHPIQSEGFVIPLSHSLRTPIDLNITLMFNFYNNPILSSQRLKIGSQVFHSQDYARVGPRKSNFIISYIHGNLTFYGIIKYFIQLDADIYLAINNLR